VLPSEIVRVTLFVGSVLAVYVVAVSALVHRLGRAPARAPLRRRIDTAALVLAAVGLACFAYGWKVEPYWPEVTHTRVPLAALPAGTPPIRIALISDVHSDPKPRLEMKLPELIAAEHPDAIVFAGDSANRPLGLPIFRTLMAALARIAPTYGVRGNWDAWYLAKLDPFAGTGVTHLAGEGTALTVRGTTLWLVGLDVGHETALSRALAGAPAGAPRVLLYHYPDLMPDARAERVDLYLAGHTHGGQVALPWYGALVTLSRFGKRYERGLYHEDGTFLYVTRGIGMEGEGPRVRFCSRPEVAILDLVAAAP
jgi:predicted MPP superfamily phosphohydrolase